MAEALFNKAWAAIKRNPKRYLYIFLLDLAFFVLFFLVNYLVNNFIPNDPNLMTRIQTNTLLLVAAILLVLAYFVIMMLAYSFFSLIVLSNVKKMSMKHTHDWRMYKNMFIVNLLVFVLFFILLLLSNMALSLLVNQSVWLAALVVLVIVIILFMAYAFYNFAHSALILKHELTHIFRKSMKHTFTWSYLGVFIFSLIVLAVYFLLYFLIGLIFKSYILAHYNTYVNWSSIITIIIVYLLFSFNRVYFYFISEKHIGHKRNL